jgi:hypothetical protein
VRYETPNEIRKANARAASARESARRNRAAREGVPPPDLGAAMARLRAWMDERDGSGGEQT